MTPMSAALVISNWLESVPTLPPTAWQALIRRVGIDTALALENNDPFNVRDQAILRLAHALSRVGAHASWSIAQAHPAGALQVNWLACGRWHHNIHVTINAGWERRQVLGSNRALPIEANYTPQTPTPVQTTDLAQSWIDRLIGDPLNITYDTAAQALQAIPGGVWITPL